MKYILFLTALLFCYLTALGRPDSGVKAEHGSEALENAANDQLSKKADNLGMDDSDESDMLANTMKKWRRRRFRFRFRRPRVRFPRVRFPRVRFPRVRLPRVRFPRVRLRRFRFPRVRLPRLRRLRLRRLRLRRLRFRFRAIRRVFRKLKKNVSHRLGRKLKRISKSFVRRIGRSFKKIFKKVKNFHKKYLLINLVKRVIGKACKKKCMKVICGKCKLPVYNPVPVAPTVPPTPPPVTDATQVSHKESAELLRKEKISFGRCLSPTASRCISLAGLRVGTLKGLLGLKEMCNESQIIIVGGTEAASNSGKKGDGWKVNLKSVDSLTVCIVENFEQVTKGCPSSKDCFRDPIKNEYHYAQVGTSDVWELRIRH